MCNCPACARRRGRRSCRLLARIVFPIAQFADYMTAEITRRGIANEPIAAVTTVLFITGCIGCLIRALIFATRHLPTIINLLSSLSLFSEDVSYSREYILEVHVGVKPALWSAWWCFMQSAVIMLICCAVCCHRCCIVLMFQPLWLLAACIAFWYLGR